MNEFSDDQIQAIVKQVLNRLGGEGAPVPAASATPASPAPAAPAPPAAAARKAVAIGADHGGYELKELLKPEIAALEFEVIDVGTHGKEAVDYPDFAHEVARLVASGKAWRGIAIDGAGIGSCIVANKVPGVRAGMAYDHATAVNSREHNDTNVLTLGAGLIGAALARQIVKTWLTTEFGGGRHEKRVNKLIAVEKSYTR